MTDHDTYARACAEAARIDAELRAAMARGHTPTPAETAPLWVARAAMRRAQPHTLRWRVTLAGGDTVSVETRDQSDWVSDTSDATAVVGAFAEVAHADRFRLRPTHAEVARRADAERDVLPPEERERVHRAAVDHLAECNRWEVAGVERAGERWRP